MHSGHGRSFSKNWSAKAKSNTAPIANSPSALRRSDSAGVIAFPSQGKAERVGRVQAEQHQQCEKAHGAQHQRTLAVARPRGSQSGYDKKERNTHHGSLTVD